VKRTIFAITTIAILSGVLVCLPNVRGQNGGTARAPRSSPNNSTSALKIAVLDFGMILKNYQKVADKRQEMKAAAETGNAKIRQMQGEGQALVKPLQEGSLDQESDEFREREKKLFQLENSIKATKATAERDMKLQSVKVSLAVYQDLQAALKLFCDQNGYTLVLKIDREAAQADDFRAVGNALGQTIVYHRAHEDITVAVLTYLNHCYETARAEAGADESPAPVSTGNEPTRTIPVSPNRKPVRR
jgi:Skp family chaperone for outer membrane proteins